MRLTTGPHQPWTLPYVAPQARTSHPRTLPSLACEGGLRENCQQKRCPHLHIPVDTTFGATGHGVGVQKRPVANQHVPSHGIRPRAYRCASHGNLCNDLASISRAYATKHALVSRCQPVRATCTTRRFPPRPRSTRNSPNPANTRRNHCARGRDGSPNVPPPTSPVGSMPANLGPVRYFPCRAQRARTPHRQHANRSSIWRGRCPDCRNPHRQAGRRYSLNPRFGEVGVLTRNGIRATRGDEVSILDLAR